MVDESRELGRDGRRRRGQKLARREPAVGEGSFTDLLAAGRASESTERVERGGAGLETKLPALSLVEFGGHIEPVRAPLSGS